MDEAETNVLVYMSFAAINQPTLHSLSERLNSEIKRRTQVVGISLNEGAITRLIGTIVPE